MRKFFSVWLILLVIVAFAAALLVSYPLLTAQAEQTASEDLNVLLDAAFTRIALAESTAKTVSDSADADILGKARAVDRFLSHDDALLQTDALVVLSEMLNVSAVDVTDMDGNIVASSVAERIGRSLTEDAQTEWTREVLAGENVSRTFVDETNAALLSGCVSRTDTEGLIYIRSLDVAIMEAMTAATPEQVLLDMSFIKDTLAVADAEGNVEGLSEADAYIVTRTQDGVTLAAARPLQQVYTARSAVLLAESIGFLLCMLFAAVIQSMLIKKRLESRRASDPALAPETAETEAEATVHACGEDVPDETDGEDAAKQTDNENAPEEPTDEAAPETRRARRKARKPRKPRQKIFEFVDIAEDGEATDGEAETTDTAKTDGSGDAGETADTGAAVDTDEKVDADVTADAAKTATDAVAVLAETLAEPLPEDADIAEEAAAEFAAPEAVLAEPAEEEPEEEAPPKRRGRRRQTADRAEATAPDDAVPAPKPRRKRRQAEPIDADSAFDKIFD